MASPFLRPKPVWRSTRPDEIFENSSPSKKFVKKGVLTSTFIDLESARGSIRAHILTVRPIDLDQLNTVKDELERWVTTTAQGAKRAILLITEGTTNMPASVLEAMAKLQMMFVALAGYSHRCAVVADSYRTIEHDNLPLLIGDSLASAQTTLQKCLSFEPIPIHKSPELMASATAAMPAGRLNPSQVDTLKTVFGSICELEAGTRNAEGRALIQDFLPPTAARDVIDFWEDEFLAAV